MAEDRKVIVAGYLINGKGDPLLPNPVILIEDSKIKVVGTTQEVSIPEIDQVDRLDYRPGFILPGLIDAHVHLCFSPDMDPVEMLKTESDDLLLLRCAQHSRQALERGVTTLRDCGGRNRVPFALRLAQDRGIIRGPRLVLCGRPLTVTGGHCYFLNGEAEGVDGLIHATRLLIKEGVDFIKVMVTGGAMTPGTAPEVAAYSVEELTAIVHEAHRVGKKVAAHCHGTEGISRAIAAGFDTIEHCSFVDRQGERHFDPKLAEQLAGQGTYVIPALSGGHRAAEQLPVGSQKPIAKDKWLFQMDSKFEIFSKMVEVGIRIAAGTDAGCRETYFGDISYELQLMVGAGMREMEAIVAATKTASEALGVDSIVGTVEEGKQADIIVVDSDPLEDISSLEKPSLVIKAGTVVYHRR